MRSFQNISVMITTKNREQDLRRTLQALRQLDPPPLEILITADGCTDETVEMVKGVMMGLQTTDYGLRTTDNETNCGGKNSVVSGQWSVVVGRQVEVKMIVNEVGLGSVASRDRMMREAKGELVLALDDDSYPEQSNCLHLLSSLFDLRPELAIATFPQRTDEYPETLTQTDFGPERPVRSFPNSGAVLRRSVYLELPGFEPKFFHMYEEPDYALQCVAAGYEVIYTPVITIRHHYSGATRSEMRNHHRHSRNEFWGVLLRCPFPQCVGLAAYRLFSQFRYACKRGFSWVVREPVWWWQAAVGIPYCLHKRQVIPWARYKKWLELP
jgi:GT2 family glycosyltransferase